MITVNYHFQHFIWKSRDLIQSVIGCVEDVEYFNLSWSNTRFSLQGGRYICSLLISSGGRMPRTPIIGCTSQASDGFLRPWSLLDYWVVLH